MNLSSVLGDVQLREEILDRLSSGGLPTPFVPTVDTATIRSIIRSPTDVERLIPGSEAESIIRLFGRPVLTIRGNSFELPQSETWRDRLSRYRRNLEATIPAVGRVEVKNHPSYEWVGTGWLVAPNVIVTNRHVADVFGSRDGGSFVFRQNFRGRQIGARMDFLEEYRQPGEAEIAVESILHIEPDDGPDIALLRIEANDDDMGSRAPIPLAKSAVSDEDVVVIGYPARDSRIPDPAAMRQVFGDVYDVKRLAPGKLTMANDVEMEHDCSTLGGNSGSVVLALSTGEAVGLHFAGSYKVANYAVPASIVQARLAKVA